MHSPETPLPSSVRRERSFLPSLIMSVGFGIAAGAVGTLLILAYVAPGVTPSGLPFPVLTDRGRGATEEVTVAALEPASRAAVVLALAKAQGAGPLDGAYVPGDAVGAGVVLTSDGWLVTHASAVAKAKRLQDLVAVVGGRAYPVRRAVTDPYTESAFLKIDAANLPVVAFGDADGLAPGQVLYAPDAAGGFVRLIAAASDAAPAETVDGLVRSSERIARVIRATSDLAPPSGTMVVDREGKAVGIVAETGTFGIAVVPVNAFSAVVGAVLRGEQPARPVLGIHYAELSQVPGRGGESLARGALVTASPDGKRPALVRRGPAETAGVRSGDVIVAVDGEPVSSKRQLADALAEYQPGETVTLSLLRGRTSESATVDVVLGSSAPATAAGQD
jgi:serine protease Do